MFQTLPEMIRPRAGEAITDYWMSFSPMAPFFGVEWRFASLMSGTDGHTPVMAEASAKMGDAMEDAAMSAAKTSKAASEIAEHVIDDLTQIKGVGPKMANELNELGITTLREIAEMGERQIDELSAQLSAFRDRPVRDDWVGQAKALMGLA
ncbi:helix-hairpin-helix domain-containing protein [Pontivivens insulae]|uniref:50S ribosomal protein L21 n=1 Tax=Pontivivens insulae TaxID=1639689 RepID=A0A2R8A9Y2_9RHOB|nr:helix-hairpin-helix domain-containing protein [Pontivivens insulae]RED12963.1 putative flap endonuclease-1-like 5' DNA nuclease [Pontivivens insulae]SPF29056.1 50S ribosomal protein L21 [Pontivivens insulae]